MNEKQRELATNRLLEIIRSGRPPAPPERIAEPVKTEPATAVEDDTGESELVFYPVADPKLKDLPASTSVEGDVEPTTPTKDRGGNGRDQTPDVDTDEVSTAALRPAWQKKITDLFKKKSKLPETDEEEGEGKKPGSLFKLKSKGKRYATIDIGTSSLKFIELMHREGTSEISKVSVTHIPPAIRKNQSALNMFLGKTIRDLMSERTLDKVNLHVIIPDQSMQIRSVGLPSISAKERVNAIKFQIKKDLPFPLEVCRLSYSGLDSKVKDRQDVEVLAADNRVLSNRLELFTDSGLVPLHVTSFPASAASLLDGYEGLDAEKGAVALVDVGAAKTTISVVDKGKISLCRTIATGGDDFTAVLQGLGLGPDGDDLNEFQAENYKKEIGLPPEGDTAMMRVAILMRPVAERISAELARSLELFRRNTMGGDIQKLILIGGSAMLKRLTDFLTKNLGVEIEVADPLARVKLAADLDEESRALIETQGPLIIPALGVALDFDNRQNLLPEDLKRFHKLKKAKRMIAPAVAALLVALVSLYSLEIQSLHEIERLAGTLRGQLEELPASRAKYMVTKAEYDRYLAELGGRDQDFDQIRIEDPEILVYLRTMSHLVPNNLYLEQLRTRFIPEIELTEELFEEEEAEAGKAPKSVASIMAGYKSEDGKILTVKRPVYGRVMELYGSVYPQGSLTDVQLVDFVFALEKSGYFRDVAVDSVRTLENGKVDFKIICGL